MFHTIDFMLQFSEPIREKVRSGALEIQGGVYDLHTGRVEFLGRSPRQGEANFLARRLSRCVGRRVLYLALGSSCLGFASVGGLVAWPGNPSW